MVPPPPGVNPRAVYRKIWWRIVPLVFCLYIVSYLDRVNLSFVKEDMCNELSFSDAVYGWGSGLFFFIGYLILEIPGAILVERWSARKWFTRILVTWGICSMAVALVKTPNQFYFARFALGLAEAGFFPGIIVYFSHWFPRAERARALAGMILSIPVSLAFGARFSNWLLEQNLFGLGGWQLVLMVEGLPAVMLGCALPFLLTDWPRQAKWLSPAEGDWLQRTLDQERNEVESHGTASIRQVIRRPTVWLLALGICAANIGGYGLVFWLPEAVTSFLLQSRPEVTYSEKGNWLMIVYAFGLAGVWLSGQSSDRTGERKWHCVAGMVLTGVFLALSSLPGQSWTLTFIWLCITEFFILSWAPAFWPLPSQTLSPVIAAAAIGFINMWANVAGMLGSPIVAQMKKAGFDNRACLLFLAGCYVTGGLIISMLHVPKLKGTPPSVRTDAQVPENG
jgi:MFS transporter, ACS family, tartrate transporter